MTGASTLTTTALWRLLIGALAFATLFALSGCEGQPPAERGAEDAPAAASGEPAAPAVPVEPAEPAPPAEPEPPPVETVRLEAVYLRPGAQPNQHYVQVERTLVGPTPCRSDSLLIELGDGAAIQWQAGQRLEVFGAYLSEAGGCRVRLDQPQHAVNVLAPPPPPEAAAVPEPPAPEPVTVRLEGTLSAVQGPTTYFLVERVLDGAFPCELVGVAFDADGPATAGDRYELEGSYDPAAANCRLTLTRPPLALRLAPPAPDPVPVALIEAPPTPEGLPFFVSGGVAMAGDIPVMQAAAGLGLTPELKGLFSAGLGSGRVALKLPSGEPIEAAVQLVLVEAAALFKVSGSFYAGASAGALFLSGEFRLPYPPLGGSARYSAVRPVVGAVLGYDLGFAMATLSVGLALGGGS